MLQKIAILLTIALFASCDKQEAEGLMPDEEQPVRFNLEVNGYTRAVSTFGPIDLTALKASADGFSVKSTGLVGIDMNNLVVKYSGGKWSYNSDYYWPLNLSQNVSFTAYAPAGTANVSLAANGLTVTNFIPGTTTASQIDLLYARPTNFTRGTSGTSGVNLSFKHLLTQILFSVTTNISASNNPKIVSIELTAPRSKGSYNPATEVWSSSNNSVIYTVFSSNTISATPVVSSPLLMIPQATLPNGTRIRVTILVNGVQRSKFINLTGLPTVTSWQPGTKVTYNVSIPKADVPGATRSDGGEQDPEIIITAQQEEW